MLRALVRKVRTGTGSPPADGATAAPPPGGVRRPPEERVAMAAAAAHVLVIDDAGDLRALFRDVLEDAGHRVSVLTHAPSVEEIARLAPDLILLDLVLGDDDEAAWRLAQALRRDDRLAAVPLVVSSAASHVLRRLEEPLRALGADIVPKPFELDDLLRAVERGLGRSGTPT